MSPLAITDHIIHGRAEDRVASAIDQFGTSQEAAAAFARRAGVIGWLALHRFAPRGDPRWHRHPKV